MKIMEIESPEEKRAVARRILESLQDWFQMSEGREQYIRESTEQICLCAYDGEKPVGFLCLKETGKDTVELVVMGVLEEYHRSGIGRQLVLQTKQIAYEKGYSFLQVKTVQMGVYEDYDRTNHFYLALGFKEFEVLPNLWDEANPCQIYVMALEKKYE
jgi:ribosomal protein S18 acetylase RimI-like enzyme